ncbi:MAG TPA: V-type ATP synthase subunit F [Thermoplasmata archaeon]|nr:V-type ATP synthase subunit F [Thermoplasmata archaeon]
MKISLIGDEDTIALFKLAGISECYNNADKFDEIVNNEETAILLLTYEFAEKLRNKIIRHRLMKELPIIVEIPGKRKIERKDTIKSLIIRAVGIEVE